MFHWTCWSIGIQPIQLMSEVRRLEGAGDAAFRLDYGIGYLMDLHRLTRQEENVFIRSVNLA